MSGFSRTGITRGRRSERTVALFFFIVVATFIAYHPALHGGPLWDDFGHITVPELRSLGGVWRIWTELGATQQYYPLLHSAFWVEHRLWGDSFLGYHPANVVFHATSAYLVVLILRRLSVPGAWLAGLLTCFPSSFRTSPITFSIWQASGSSSLSPARLPSSRSDSR